MQTYMRNSFNYLLFAMKKKYFWYFCRYEMNEKDINNIHVM